MHYSDLIALYFERSNALQNYWTLYVVVIGGLLAISALRRDPDVAAGLLVSMLFCAFAYKNLDAIHDVTEQRFAIRSAIQQFQNDSGDNRVSVQTARQLVEPTLSPPKFEGVRNFHVACDVGTIVTMWLMQWRRAKHLQNSVPSRE